MKWIRLPSCCSFRRCAIRNRQRGLLIATCVILFLISTYAYTWKTYSLLNTHISNEIEADWIDLMDEELRQKSMLKFRNAFKTVKDNALNERVFRTEFDTFVNKSHAIRILELQNDYDNEISGLRKRYMCNQPQCIGYSESMNTFNLSLEVYSFPELQQQLLTKHNFGGGWGPTTCLHREKIAIIVPYRARDLHLSVLVKNLVPFLIKQNVYFKIYVIEPSQPVLFNRAYMLNIGYMEAQKDFDYDCYIFHDVDLLPEHLCNTYTCSKHPQHLASGISKFGYGMPYPDYFGGVIIMSKEHMKAINGFSNSYFGWGGEDDDAFFRLYRKGLNITRPPPNVGRYTMILHEDDTTNPKTGISLEDVASHVGCMKHEGLSNMRYTVQATHNTPMFTHILVKVPGPVHLDDVMGYYRRQVMDLPCELFTLPPQPTEHSALLGWPKPPLPDDYFKRKLPSMLQEAARQVDLKAAEESLIRGFGNSSRT